VLQISLISISFIFLVDRPALLGQHPWPDNLFDRRLDSQILPVEWTVVAPGYQEIPAAVQQLLKSTLASSLSTTSR
jgi:hypothetical protein